MKNFIAGHLYTVLSRSTRTVYHAFFNTEGDDATGKLTLVTLDLRSGIDEVMEIRQGYPDYEILLRAVQDVCSALPNVTLFDSSLTIQRSEKGEHFARQFNDWMGSASEAEVDQHWARKYTAYPLTMLLLPF